MHRQRRRSRGRSPPSCFWIKFGSQETTKKNLTGGLHDDRIRFSQILTITLTLSVFLSWGSWLESLAVASHPLQPDSTFFPAPGNYEHNDAKRGQDYRGGEPS